MQVLTRTKSETAKSAWSLSLPNRLGYSLDEAGNVRLAPWSVVAVFVCLALSTFGLPLLLGLSWWPLPDFLQPQVRTPASAATLDNFSFAHLDWPWRVLEAKQLLAGRFPLWNSYSSLGLPFAGQYENQLFLPLEWVEIFGGPTVWSLLLMGKMVLAAVGSYLVCRWFVRSDVPALVGAILYMFSAYFLWLYPHTAFVNGALLAPWLFWGILRLRSPEARVLPACGLTSLVIGLMFLSGQPQIAFLNLAGGGAYLLIATLISPKSRRSVSALVLFAVSAGIGLGIAGIQLRTFWEALEHGQTLHSPAAYAGAGTAVLNFTLPVWPFLMGQFRPWVPSLFPNQITWEAFPIVLGGFGLFFLAVTLAGLPVALLRRKEGGPRHIGAMLAIFALILGVVVAGAAGMPVWSWPIADRVNFPRYISPVLSLTLAVLVAWGVASLREVSMRRLVVANLLVLAAGAAALRLIAPYVLAPAEPVQDTYMRASLLLGFFPFFTVLACANIVVLTVLRGSVTVARAQIALVVCLAAELGFYVRYGLDLAGEMGRLLVLAAFAGSSLLVLAHRGRFLVAILPGLSLATLVILGSAPHRLAATWDPFAAPPQFIQFLKQQVGEGSKGGRVLATEGVLLPNVATGFGIAELASLNPVQVGTTANYVSDALAPKPLIYVVPNHWKGMIESQDTPSWADYFWRRRYYNLVGVRYLLDFPNGWLSQNPRAGIQLVYRDDRVHVYEDLQALPRAFAVETERTRLTVGATGPANMRADLPRRNDALTHSQVCGYPVLPSVDAQYAPLFWAVDPTTGSMTPVWQGPDGRQYQQRVVPDPGSPVSARTAGCSIDIASGLLTGGEPTFGPLTIVHYADDRLEVVPPDLPRREDAVTFAQVCTYPVLPSADARYFRLFLAVDPASRDTIPVWQGPGGRQYQQRVGLDRLAECSDDIALEPSTSDEPAFRPLSIVAYADDRVEIDANLERSSLVILTDAYYPGWKVYVDGEARPIHRVDSIVRGVLVEGGAHQVSFRYEPEYLHSWVAVSVGSASVALMAMLLPWLARRILRPEWSAGWIRSAGERRVGIAEIRPPLGAGAIVDASIRVLFRTARRARGGRLASPRDDSRTPVGTAGEGRHSNGEHGGVTAAPRPPRV